jgi:hypothetical protein
MSKVPYSPVMSSLKWALVCTIPKLLIS